MLLLLYPEVRQRNEILVKDRKELAAFVSEILCEPDDALLETSITSAQLREKWAKRKVMHSFTQRDLFTPLMCSLRFGDLSAE